MAYGSRSTGASRVKATRETKPRKGAKRSKAMSRGSHPAGSKANPGARKGRK